MRETVQRGVIGVGSVTLGTVTSFLGQLETWLRVCSLLVGLLVGIASFVSIVRKLRRDK